MAKTKTRGRAKAKASITRHPLFPAMIAIWCAALLSLGSLAIGTVALENLVLALRIDLVLPAAAPPLGIKARILLALALFVLGAVSGFMLARRIARPQDTAAQRSFRKNQRADRSVADGEDSPRRDAAAAHHLANPIPGRRRALAMEEDYTSEFQEQITLPGGAPQILDLADLGAFDDMSDADGSNDRGDALDGFGAHEDEPDAATHLYDPWNRHTERPMMATQQPAVPSMIALAAEAPVIDASRPFAAPSANPISAFATADEEVRPDFPPSSFAPPTEIADEQAEPAPLPFAPLAAAFAAPEPDPETKSCDTEMVDAAAALRVFTAPVAPAFEPDPEIAVALEPAASPSAVEAEPVAAVLGLVPSDAAEKLMAAPIASLGVVELAERLALAISRRRGGADSASIAETALAAPEARMPAPVQHFSAPNAFAPPVESVAAEPPALAYAQPQEQPQEQAAPSRFAVPPAFAPPPAFAQPTPPAAVNPITAMAATTPTAMPSAMRPLSFDDQDDDDSLASVLPPRLVGRPVRPVSTVGQVFPVQPVAAEAEAAHAETQDGADEESFGSLLGMKPTLRETFARETFVRVEEPVDDHAPVEPVVVFPGQAAHTPPHGDAGPRRFDSPGAMASGKAPLTPMTTSPDETERALKAALATLQRMSGAA